MKCGYNIFSGRDAISTSQRGPKVHIPEEACNLPQFNVYRTVKINDWPINVKKSFNVTGHLILKLLSSCGVDC